MAMGRRKVESQWQMFIALSDLPATAGHAFYEKLNQCLRAMDFDRKAEDLCQRFYKEAVGRPSIPPGVYFRLLLIGYFEGIQYIAAKLMTTLASRVSMPASNATCPRRCDRRSQSPTAPACPIST